MTNTITAAQVTHATLQKMAIQLKLLTKPNIQTAQYASLIEQHQDAVIKASLNDTYILVKVIVEMQRLYNQPYQPYLDHFQHVVSKQHHTFPLLLQCLKLKQQPDPKVLATLPNQINTPLIHAVFNALIKNHMMALTYRESTAVLTYLLNRDLLLAIRSTNWVMQLIRISQTGIKNKDLKNLAMLSRIYCKCSKQLLGQVANQVEQLKLDKKSQRSYVTMYYAFSYLENKQSILQQLSQQIQINETTLVQDLMQLLIGAIQSDDKNIAYQIYLIIKHRQLNQMDKSLMMVAASQFGLFSKQECTAIMSGIDNILSSMKHKQIGQFCLNMSIQYQVDFYQYFNKHREQINHQNIVNLYTILLEHQSELKLMELVEQYIKDKQIDLLGLIKLQSIIDLSESITEMVKQLKYSDITSHVKEVSALIIAVENHITNIDDILKHCIYDVEQGISSSVGLGNLMYIASKKTCHIDNINEQLVNQIINEADPLELINFVKALDNWKQLTEEYKYNIQLSVMNKITNMNRQRTLQANSRLPKELALTIF